jgi:hypothetical protein
MKECALERCPCDMNVGCEGGVYFNCIKEKRIKETFTHSPFFYFYFDLLMFKNDDGKYRRDVLYICQLMFEEITANNFFFFWLS